MTRRTRTRCCAIHLTFHVCCVNYDCYYCCYCCLLNEWHDTDRSPRWRPLPAPLSLSVADGICYYCTHCLCCWRHWRHHWCCLYRHDCTHLCMLLFPLLSLLLLMSLMMKNLMVALPIVVLVAVGTRELLAEYPQRSSCSRELSFLARGGEKLEALSRSLEWAYNTDLCTWRSLVAAAAVVGCGGREVAANGPKNCALVAVPLEISGRKADLMH